MRVVIAFVHVIALLTLLLCATGCTDAGKCTRGQIGCVCTADDTCGTGAVCIKGMCEDDPSPDTKMDSGPAPEPDAGPDEPPDAGPPTPNSCSGVTLEEACGNFCEALCQNEQRHCAESRCTAEDCKPSESGSASVFDICVSNCKDEDDPAACARASCRGQRDQECEDFGFEDANGVFQSGCFDQDPECLQAINLGCTDTCGTQGVRGIGGQLADNGSCDDGGSNSDADLCTRGTDCTDCGVRTCSRTGARCTGNGDCCGFFADGAFCVDVPSLGPTCLIACDSADDCPNMLSCVLIDTANDSSVCAPNQN